MRSKQCSKNTNLVRVSIHTRTSYVPLGNTPRAVVLDIPASRSRMVGGLIVDLARLFGVGLELHADAEENLKIIGFLPGHTGYNESLRVSSLILDLTRKEFPNIKTRIDPITLREMGKLLKQSRPERGEPDRLLELPVVGSRVPFYRHEEEHFVS